MICAWQEFLSILSPWIRSQMDSSAMENLQELRLRIGQPPYLFEGSEKRRLSGVVKENDLSFCINAASHYSPWAAQTSAKGYITAPGGHRIGICGEAVVEKGTMTGYRSIKSVCIRVARDYRGIAQKISCEKGSFLLIGPPGSGKTTMLRDLIRNRSKIETISVIDERCELFPSVWEIDVPIDILTGCPKSIGVENLLKTMGPSVIAVDEITSIQDCDAIMEAARCGVSVFATIHADGMYDLQRRPIYRSIVENGIFDYIVILKADKSWILKEMPS